MIILHLLALFNMKRRGKEKKIIFSRGNGCREKPTDNTRPQSSKTTRTNKVSESPCRLHTHQPTTSPFSRLVYNIPEVPVLGGHFKRQRWKPFLISHFRLDSVAGLSVDVFVAYLILIIICEYRTARNFRQWKILSRATVGHFFRHLYYIHSWFSKKISQEFNSVKQLLWRMHATKLKTWQKFLLYSTRFSILGFYFLLFQPIKTNFAIHPTKVQLELHWQCCRSSQVSQLVPKVSTITNLVIEMEGQLCY